MPSMGPKALEIASTVGWSMTTATRSCAFWPPTSISLTFTSPIEPNTVNSGRGTPLSRPASRATLLLSRLIGAPVSKISLYGPLPLTFTITVMWPVLSTSKGTTTGLASFAGTSARAGAATSARARAAGRSCFLMSQALPRGETEFDLLLVLAALDPHLDLVAGRHLARELLQAVQPVDRAALELDEAVARLQAGRARRPVRQDALDHGHAVVVDGLQA